MRVTAQILAGIVAFSILAGCSDKQTSGSPVTTDVPVESRTDTPTTVVGTSAVEASFDTSFPTVDDCPDPGVVSGALEYGSATPRHEATVVSDGLGGDLHLVTCNYVLPDEATPQVVAVVQLYNLADADRLDLLLPYRDGSFAATRRDDLGEEVYLSIAGGCSLLTKTGLSKVSLVTSSDDRAEDCRLAEALFVALR